MFAMTDNAEHRLMRCDSGREAALFTFLCKKEKEEEEEEEEEDDEQDEDEKEAVLRGTPLRIVETAIFFLSLSLSIFLFSFVFFSCQLSPFLSPFCLYLFPKTLFLLS